MLHPTAFSSLGPFFSLIELIPGLSRNSISPVTFGSPTFLSIYIPYHLQRGSILRSPRAAKYVFTAICEQPLLCESTKVWYQSCSSQLFVLYLFIYNPLNRSHISDSRVLISDASLIENNTTSAHAESYINTNHGSSGLHATTYNIADILHQSNVLSSNTEGLDFCGPTTHRLDVSHEAYTPLTQQALLQHNTKCTPLDGEKAQKLSPTNSKYTVVHACILTADHVAEKRYVYHHPQRQLYTLSTSLPAHEQHVELGSRHLDQPIKYPCLHPYPIVI